MIIAYITLALVFALGGLMVVRPDLMLRFQIWTQKVIMGAEYTPSARTYTAMRVVGVFVILVSLISLVSVANESRAPGPIGGDRDAHGCLAGAGYSFDAEVGACVRAFDMTPDIAQAAKLAVESVGQSYALTVVSFNSYEEPGAYDIVLRRGTDSAPQTVHIRGGKVVASPAQ